MTDLPKERTISTEPHYDGTPVKRIFDAEGNFQGFNVAPDVKTWTEEDICRWSASLVVGETGLEIEIVEATGVGAALKTNFLTEKPEGRWTDLSLILTGVLAGYNARHQFKGKHNQTDTFGFPSLFGNGIF